MFLFENVRGLVTATGETDEPDEASFFFGRLNLGQGQEDVPPRARDVPLQPEGGAVGVPRAAGLEDLAVVAPGVRDVPERALVRVRAEELVAAVGVGDDLLGERVAARAQENPVRHKGVGLFVQVVRLIGIHGGHYSKKIPGGLDLHTRLWDNSARLVYKKENAMSRFVTFGEIMMRLNPEGYGRFVQAERLEASYAGGEANVAVSVAEQLVKRFGCKKVAITLRTSLSAFDSLWAGMLYDAKAKKACFSKEYALHIVDRVGGGDSFGGGLIYALATGKKPQAAIDFAVAVSALSR